MDKTKRKIAIISHSLADGGAERFAGLLSKMLHGLGHEIHVVTINDKIDYPFSGQLFNLGIDDNRKGFISRKWGKGYRLYHYLKEAEIDTVIDNRTRNYLIRDIISKFIFGSRDVYYMVHSCKLESYFSKLVFWNRWLYGNAAKLVCVSNAIREKVISRFGFTNCITIYNPVQKIEVESSIFNEIEKPYILYFGRLENRSKNLILLLEAYKISGINEKGIKLILMGAGENQSDLEKYISLNNLDSSISILPYQKNPFSVVKNAKFTVLTSNYEGFPMSVIESLSLGVPVVSVDCPSGPSEVIQNEYNGVLVENHNAEALAKAFNKMIEDEQLYDFCKSNAQKSVAHLSEANITKAWENLLNH